MHLSCICCAPIIASIMHLLYVIVPIVHLSCVCCAPIVHLFLHCCVPVVHLSLHHCASILASIMNPLLRLLCTYCCAPWVPCIVGIVHALSHTPSVYCASGMHASWHALSVGQYVDCYHVCGVSTIINVGVWAGERGERKRKTHWWKVW
jgi:hypothetical protein